MSDISKAPKGAALCGMLALAPSPPSLLWPKSGAEVDDVFSQIGGVVGGWEDGQTETRGWEWDGPSGSGKKKKMKKRNLDEQKCSCLSLSHSERE